MNPEPSTKVRVQGLGLCDFGISGFGCYGLHSAFPLATFIDIPNGRKRYRSTLTKINLAI